MSGLIPQLDFLKLSIGIGGASSFVLVYVMRFWRLLDSNLSDLESVADIFQHKHSMAIMIPLNLDYVWGIDCADDQRSTGLTESRILFFWEYSGINLVNARTVVRL